MVQKRIIFGVTAAMFASVTFSACSSTNANETPAPSTVTPSTVTPSTVAPSKSEQAVSTKKTYCVPLQAAMKNSAAARTSPAQLKLFTQNLDKAIKAAKADGQNELSAFLTLSAKVYSSPQSLTPAEAKMLSSQEAVMAAQVEKECGFNPSS